MRHKDSNRESRCGKEDYEYFRISEIEELHES